MKKYLSSYLVFLCLFLTLVTIILWIVKPTFSYNPPKITAPLPSFLTRTENQQVLGVNLWTPSDSELKNLSNKPEISAKSAIAYDLTKNKIIFEKNSKEKLPMASLTKIMTAIIALENKKENDQYYVSKNSLVGENSMGLTDGEVYTLDELLHGLMMVSGNDAAEALADNYPLGRENFIEAMNKKVKAFGLTDTNFTNPSGLEGDGNQYTTAYDLLVITKYALSNFPEFRDVVSTYEFHIPYSESHKELWLYNEINLLTSYPGVKGVKDGYTPEAGLCLVTYLDYQDRQIIGVILGSENRRDEMRSILDYSLKSSGINPPKHN